MSDGRVFLDTNVLVYAQALMHRTSVSDVAC